MTSHRERLEPIGGPVLTRPFIVLGALAALALLLVAWRFVVGLGPATGLTDGYPWGAWKVFNVIVLTALGSGGYLRAISSAHFSFVGSAWATTSCLGSGSPRSCR